MLEVKEVRFAGINITRDGIQKIQIKDPPKPVEEKPKIEENPEIKQKEIPRIAAEDIKPDWLDEKIQKKLQKEKSNEKKVESPQDEKEID